MITQHYPLIRVLNPRRNPFIPILSVGYPGLDLCIGQDNAILSFFAALVNSGTCAHSALNVSLRVALRGSLALVIVLFAFAKPDFKLCAAV